MNFHETLKKYFEQLIQNDEAIKAVYDEKKINECTNYIFNMAKKEAAGNCAVVSDEIVYKWARDFYLGDINEKAANSPCNYIAKLEHGDDEEQERKKPSKNKKKETTVSKPDFETDQLMLFEY